MMKRENMVGNGKKTGGKKVKMGGNGKKQEETKKKPEKGM